MKRYSFVFLSYLKFLSIFILIIILFASCGTDDQDLVDVDAEVNIGDTINENNGTQIIVNSGDVYINQDSIKDTTRSETQIDNVLNDGIYSITTTSTTTVTPATTTYSTEATTANSATTSNITQLDNNLYNIPAINKNNLTVDLIKNKKTTLNNVDFITYDGFLGYEGQIDEYEIITYNSGKYRFDISNTLSQTKIRIEIYDSLNNRIANESLTSNQGVTVELESNSFYSIKIKQMSNIDNYTLTIGQPKLNTDISNYFIINDSIEFKDQMNIYTYTPTITGRYRFNFSEIQHGIKLSLGVYDSKNNRVGYNNNLGNNSGITVDLTANEKYSIQIGQNGDFGKYILNIGKQKEIKDVSDYTQINDSIEFTDQRNIYTYTPKIDGNYYIGFSEIINGVDMTLFVKNKLGETLKNNNYTIRNNDGVSYNLKGGEQYTIYVVYRNNYSTYQMNIGTQKETVDVTLYSQIKDSVEYKTQQNNYIFIPNKSSSYKLDFKDMKSDFTLSVVVRDELDYKVSENNYIDNKDSMKLENLTAGQVYTIQITQKSQFGEYTFSISQDYEQ